jgi:hypothetical protein
VSNEKEQTLVVRLNWIESFSAYITWCNMEDNRRLGFSHIGTSRRGGVKGQMRHINLRRENKTAVKGNKEMVRGQERRGDGK